MSEQRASDTSFHVANAAVHPGDRKDCPTCQPASNPPCVYRQVGVKHKGDKTDFLWWESLPEGTAVYVAEVAR